MLTRRCAPAVAAALLVGGSIDAGAVTHGYDRNLTSASDSARSYDS